MDKKVIVGGLAAVVFVLLLCFVMCDGGSIKPTKPKLTRIDTKQLENEYASGVVLICNSTYYSITFKDVLTLYFSELDDDGNITGLTIDEDEVEPVISWGTGFFISKDGLIATNSHVASHVIDMSHVRSQIVNGLTSETDELKTDINNLNEQIATLNKRYDDSRDYQTKKKIAKLRKDRDDLQGVINSVNKINTAEYSVDIVSQNYVAFNDTYITNLNDLRGCHLVCNDPDHDLAIIQLGGDKKTPEDRHVFEWETKVTTSEPLYIIGFNYGPDLASTTDGIKAQITEGKMSQDRGDTFVHTITTLPGSSGSPILNNEGKVVGVNYAMLKDAEVFKFGVKAKFLEDLVNKANIK